MNEKKDLEKIIQETDKSESIYINNEIVSFQQASDEAAREANLTSRNLSNQLTAVSGAIVVLSSGLLSNRFVELPFCWKIILICSWVILFLSTIFGVAQARKDAKFFVKWKDYNLDIAKELGTSKYTSKNAYEAINKFLKPQGTSGEQFQNFQMILLLIGSLMFLTIIGRSIF